MDLDVGGGELANRDTSQYDSTMHNKTEMKAKAW